MAENPVKAAGPGAPAHRRAASPYPVAAAPAMRIRPAAWLRRNRKPPVARAARQAPSEDLALAQSRWPSHYLATIECLERQAREAVHRHVPAEKFLEHCAEYER